MRAHRPALVAALCIAAASCNSGSPAAPGKRDRSHEVISDAAHNSGTPGIYFLRPMMPAQPAQLGHSAPPGSFGGPWVVIDRISLPAGCVNDCPAQVITPNVTTITRTATSDGTGIPVSKGDARNRLVYHVNRVPPPPGDSEPDADLDDVPDGYWSTHWESDDFGTLVNGIYRAHVFVGSVAQPLELGFADIEIVPDGISNAVWKKIDRTEFVPLKFGHTLLITFQIEPSALVCLGVACTASDSCHLAGVCDRSTGACSTRPRRTAPLARPTAVSATAGAARARPGTRSRTGPARRSTAASSITAGATALPSAPAPGPARTSAAATRATPATARAARPASPSPA